MQLSPTRPLAGVSFDEANLVSSAGLVPLGAPRASIGSLLLEALIEAARAQRNPALSLSVEPDNPARRLYERHGFQVIGTVDGSLTMLLPR